MPDIATANFEVVRGNTETITIEFFSDDEQTVPFDLTGSTLIFRAVSIADDEEKFRAEMTITAPGVAAFDMTEAQSRALPKVSACNYEVERRIGGQSKTILYGTIRGVLGANDDVGA